ncbi:hypothetical protein BaRGS_00031098 [Batillaria attramentaria]|uniref:Uncharacterized protein n=1 Tax=Batillaria attramentaria TaxID=370345 RepID=A0ABD0JSV8_9CAEN
MATDVTESSSHKRQFLSCAHLSAGRNNLVVSNLNENHAWQRSIAHSHWTWAISMDRRNNAMVRQNRYTAMPLYGHHRQVACLVHDIMTTHSLSGALYYEDKRLA